MDAKQLEATMERHAPGGYDPASDDMTIPFAIKLAEQDKKIEALERDNAELMEILGRCIMDLPGHLRAKDPSPGIRAVVAALRPFAEIGAGIPASDNDARPFTQVTQDAKCKGTFSTITVGHLRAAAREINGTHR